VQIQQNPSRKPKLWWRKQGASGRVSISLSPSEEQDLLDTAHLHIKANKKNGLWQLLPPVVTPSCP